MTTNPTHDSNDQSLVFASEATDHAVAQYHRKHARMALRLAKEHGADLRHVHSVGWHVWENGCWVPDDKDRVQVSLLLTKQDAIMESATLVGPEREDLQKDAGLLDTANNINGTITIAKSLSPISTSVKELDPDPFLVNMPDGVYDLRTGETLSHDRQVMHTKMTGCSTYGARKDGLWYQFLEQVLPDPEVRKFAQKILGYAMLGKVREQIFPIFYGVSGTGKSTFMDSIHEAFGTYANIAPTTLLLSTGTRQSHPTEIAGLRGQRLVMVHETEKSQPLKTAAMKNMTGGDRLTGRFMGKDFFTFTPSHTFVLVSNFPPVLDADDDAAWSRIRVVPFLQHFRNTERENVGLGDQIIEQDLASVLQWVLDGYVLYTEEGLKDIPEAVLAQTKEHQTEVDSFTEFLNEEVTREAGRRVLFSDLYTAWRDWAKPQMIPPGRKNDFQTKLDRRGFKTATLDRQKWVMDVELPTNEQPCYAPMHNRQQAQASNGNGRPAGSAQGGYPDGF
jgi:putative DNA primase/helicase